MRPREAPAMITSVNPCVVCTPDDRVGVLTGRIGLVGVIELKPPKAKGIVVVSTLAPLVLLGYHVADAPDMSIM